MEIDNANDHEDQNMQLPQHAIEAHNELQAANLADHNENEVHILNYLIIYLTIRYVSNLLNRLFN